jgi:hypothetical protein
VDKQQPKTVWAVEVQVRVCTVGNTNSSRGVRLFVASFFSSKGSGCRTGQSSTTEITCEANNQDPGKSHEARQVDHWQCPRDRNQIKSHKSWSWGTCSVLVVVTRSLL